MVALGCYSIMTSFVMVIEYRKKELSGEMGLMYTTWTVHVFQWVLLNNSTVRVQMAAWDMINQLPAYPITANQLIIR